MVRTKIIATIGPASSEESVLRKMFKAGLDVVRLNFSHGTHKEHLAKIETVRALNKKLKRSIKILQDLEGYRIRVGNLELPRNLKKGGTYYLTQEQVADDEKQIPFDYQGSLKQIKTGAFIFIDDGRVVLEVKSIDKKRLKFKVIIDGVVKSHKGINIAGANLKFSALTAKDEKDVAIAIKYKLDYVAQSFVRNGKDLSNLKKILKPQHPACKLFAKVENQQAVDNLDEIINEADGVMVARGDLGICVPIYKVPVLQKEIIKRCRLKNKPVIVATQMMESMIENRLPTRAEVSDVGNAIFDQADFLLLSGETAIGKHPALVIDMMNKVIKYTENYQQKVKDLLH